MSRAVTAVIILAVAAAMFVHFTWFSQPIKEPFSTGAQREHAGTGTPAPGKLAGSPSGKTPAVPEKNDTAKTAPEKTPDPDEDDDLIGTIDPDSPAAPYLEAFKLIEMEGLDELQETIWKIMEEGWNEEHPEIVKFLEKNREAMIKLKAAIDRGDCYFPVPEDADYDFRMPHLSYCNDAKMLLVLETRFFEKEADVENAARNIADGIRFSQDVTKGGTLINDLVGISIQKEFLELIHGEIGKEEPNLRFCSAIERSIYDLEFTQAPVAKGLDVERLTAKNTFERFLSLDEKERIKVMAPLFRGRDMGTVDSEAAAAPHATEEGIRECMRLYDEYHNELTNALEEGLTAAIRKAEELGKKIETNANAMPELFTRLCPSFNHYLKSKARRKVEYEMARAGVALELYAAKNGKYPDSLKDLTPKYLPRVPVDTFSGRPMKYASSKNGYTLYSFGYDMDDDGAKEKTESGRDDGDVVLSKERK